MKISASSSIAAVVVSLVLTSCGGGPGAKGAGDKQEAAKKRSDEDVAKEEAKTEAVPDAQLRGVNVEASIPTSTVTKEETVHLRPASFNLNRYKDGGRLNSSGDPKVGATGATSHDQVLTAIANTNGWDIIALQEVLDEKDTNGKYFDEAGRVPVRDADFPDIAGYEKLEGGIIKEWFKANPLHEHCPIYYKVGEIESCSTVETQTVGNSGVHWAECTLKKGDKKKFHFGCAHISYGNVALEVDRLGKEIKKKATKAQQAGGKFEFILGMDANSFHTAGARHNTSWTGDFMKHVPDATLPAFPDNSFTKISKRKPAAGDQHGPPNNPQNRIYDWLVFNVKVSLEYVPGSLRVTPVSSQLSYTGGPNNPVAFNKAWFESFSDHLPVDALFTIK